MSQQKVIDYANENFNAFVEQLKTLVKIPSVSFDGFPPEEVARSAGAVADLLREQGLENVEVLEIEGAHPYVYADWLHAEGKPTLLLYAHHDVQPPGREERWKTEPFVPTQVGERLFARGAADDKAGIIVHTSAIGAYLKTVGTLPVNVRVIIEGEEEIGSGHLEQFLSTYKDRLSADAIVLTDTENFDVGVPAITTSLRGILAMGMTVEVMDHPLHSGMYGGPGPDPVIAMSKMIASLVDDQGRIAIPGIYDKVRGLVDVERESMDILNYTDETYRKRAHLNDGVSIVGPDAPPLQKMWRLPAVSVNALEASSRKNCSNIVNEAAWCKIGMRIVPDMQIDETIEMIQTHLRKNAPWGVKVTFDKVEKGNWWVTTPEGPAFEKARAALTKAFGNECVFIGQGGSIPFVEPFSNVLNAPALLIGVEDPQTNAHSENESVHLGDLKKSIAGAIYLYEEMASL